MSGPTVSKSSYTTLITGCALASLVLPSLLKALQLPGSAALPHHLLRCDPSPTVLNVLSYVLSVVKREACGCLCVLRGPARGFPARDFHASRLLRLRAVPVRYLTLLSSSTS